MRVIIAGSREITDLNLVMDVIDRSHFEFTEVLSGCARGVDMAMLMKPWACRVRKFHAKWNVFGKQAGFLRNEEMAWQSDALIAISTGSPGTRHMISIMRRDNKPVEVVPVELATVNEGRDGQHYRT